MHLHAGREAQNSHRTIVLPSKIRLDTVPPVIAVKHPQYPIFSPDGDGHHDFFRIPYRVSEPAHAILLVRGRQVLFTRGQKLTGVLVWNGKVRGAKGKLVRATPGRYLLSIAAEDRAGNRSKSFPFAIAQIRYVVLARTRVSVRAGATFALRVSTDAPTVAWRLNRASGTERSGTLHFRAPRKPGIYHLYVSAAGHAAACGGRLVSAGLAQAAGAIGAVGIALLFVAPRRDLRIAGLAAWAVGCAGLTIYLAPPGHQRVLAAAGVVGLVLAVAGAWIFLRVPWLLAVATLACVPARIPVPVGSTKANLLLPLYGVVAVAAFALAWQLYRGDVRTQELGLLRWPLALFVAWAGVSSSGRGTCARARTTSSSTSCRSRFSRSARATALVAAVGAGAVCPAGADGARVRGDRDRAVRTRNIYWNPKVRVDNAYAPSSWFYRVNSVFYDPSIYGRFLVSAFSRPRPRAAPPRRSGCGRCRRADVGITWVGLVPRSRSRASSRSPSHAARRLVVGAGASLAPLAVAAAVLVVAARRRLRPATASSARRTRRSRR